MQDTEDLFAREFQALRIALIREEFRRVRIAAWGLLAVALAVLVFLGFEIHTGATDKGPAWSFVALLDLASIFLAVPLIGKLSLSKDGGAIDLVSPIERIDRLELRAQAARVESFEQTRQQISGLSQQVEQLAEALEATRSIPTTGREDESSLRDGKKEVSLREIRLRLEAITDQQDQQKGRFGGFESSDGRRLKAEVSKSEFGKDWQNVVFTLVSENGKALEGAYVYFFVHETFDPDTYRVKVPPGAMQVSFESASKGAYTAGVAAEMGATLLEIDLATSPNVVAPEWWKRL